MLQAPPRHQRFAQSGFTLIELIIVIVILGVMAAMALPKLLSLKTEARVTVLTQLAKSLHASATAVRMKCLSQGCAGIGGESVLLEGERRAVWYGYPIENSHSNVWWGINDVLDLQGFDYSFQSSAPPTAFFSPTGALDPTGCRVTYWVSDSIAPPVITLTTSAC